MVGGVITTDSIDARLMFERIDLAWRDVSSAKLGVSSITVKSRSGRTLVIASRDRDVRDLMLHQIRTRSIPLST